MIADHQPCRPRVERHADLTLGRLVPGVGVDQRDPVTGHRPAHRARLDRLPGRVGDLHGRLGLAETVPDRHPPGLVDLIDDLGVERFAGAHDDARRGGERRQVGLDHHPPHRGRRAETGHAAALHLAHQPGRVEPRVVVDEDAGLRVPGREDVAPRVLGPARRRDVEVHVARFQTDPVHGREVPDRVRSVGVLDQFGPCGGARGEVEQQSVGREGGCVGREVGARGVGVGERPPAVDRRAHRDPGDLGPDLVELARRGRGGEHVLSPAPSHPPGRVGRAEQRSGGDQHRAELHGGEDRVPQFGLVAQHHHDPVTPAYALVAQPVGHLAGPAGHLGEREPLLGAVLLDDPEGGRVVAGRDHVEPVERPVELAQLGPPELLDRRVVLLAVRQQEVACGLESRRTVERRHVSLPAQMLIVLVATKPRSRSPVTVAMASSPPSSVTGLASARWVALAAYPRAP